MSEGQCEGRNLKGEAEADPDREDESTPDGEMEGDGDDEDAYGEEEEEDIDGDDEDAQLNVRRSRSILRNPSYAIAR